MEFGSPPLYKQMNQVARDMDMSQIFNLGPINQAISLIANGGEEKRNADDKVKTGKQIQSEIGGVEWNFAGSFLLFRGAQV